MSLSLRFIGTDVLNLDCFISLSLSLVACPGDCQGDGTEKTTAAAAEREERYATGEDSAPLLQAELCSTIFLSPLQKHSFSERRDLMEEKTEEIKRYPGHLASITKCSCVV